MTHALMIAAAHSVGSRLARAAKTAAHGVLCAIFLSATFLPSVFFLCFLPLAFVAMEAISLSLKLAGMPPMILGAPFDHPGPMIACWIGAMALASAALGAWAAIDGTRAELIAQGASPWQALVASPFGFVGGRLGRFESAYNSNAFFGPAIASAQAILPFALGCLGFPLLMAMRAAAALPGMLPSQAPSIASAKKSWGAALNRLAQESPQVLARMEAKELGAHASAPTSSEQAPPRL